MTEVLYQTASASREGEIWALYEAVKAFYRPKGLTDWDDDYPDREILSEDLECRRIRILQDGDKIIGAVSFEEEDDVSRLELPWEGARAMVFARLCVAPEFRGRRLAEELLLRLLAEAESLGYDSARILCAKVTIPARKLYERMKFRQMGSVTLYGKDFWIYEKMIREAVRTG